VDQNTFISSGNNNGAGSPCIYLGNNSVSAALINSTFNYNTINGCTGEGMRFAGNLSNSTVVGNRVEGTVGSGIDFLNFPGAGKCNGLVVAENLVDFTTAYGISVQAGCNNNLIQNNDVQNNPSGGITNGGSSNNVRYNIGYKTENQGSATISASTTVVVNHGLVGAPTSVTVTSQANGYGTVWVTSVSSTQFTIAVTTSGTYSFYWSAVYWP
jgi:hypothetical protein